MNLVSAFSFSLPCVGALRSLVYNQQTGTNRHCTRFLVVADVLSLFSLPYQLLNSFSTERLTPQNIARHALLPCCRTSAGLICSDGSFTRAPRDGDTNSDWYLELRQQKCHHWLCGFSRITFIELLV